VSIQKSILAKQATLQRKLFDNTVQVMGLPTSVTFFKITEDDFGDETTTVLKKDTIDVIFNFPAEIPLDRYRVGNDEKTSVDESHTFFFEVLPIEVYTKFSDNVEKGDLLIYTITDDQNNPINLLLKISETFGGGRVSLVWKKQYCALYNGIIPTALKQVLGLL